MNPNYYSKVCPTTGLVVFFVKEFIEYLGIVIEKKTNYKRAILTFTSCLELIDYVQNQIKIIVDK